MPPPYVSALRVYEPLAAYPPEEQRAWRAYARSGRAPGVVEGGPIERRMVWSAVGSGLAPRLEALTAEAYVLEHDGMVLISPWQTRERAAEAALEAREGVPATLAEAFVPTPLRAAAERVRAAEARTERGRRDRRDPDPTAGGRRHVRTATWGPPVRWFTLVEPGERRVLTGGAGGRGRAVVYRTEMSRARRRGARALAVLRRALDDVPVVAAMEELARWLEEFHPRSVVELDYGRVADVLADDVVEDDTSAADVTEALAALAAGDGARASEAYQRVTERWRSAQAAEHLN